MTGTISIEHDERIPEEALFPVEYVRVELGKRLGVTVKSIVHKPEISDIAIEIEEDHIPKVSLQARSLGMHHYDYLGLSVSAVINKYYKDYEYELLNGH